MRLIDAEVFEDLFHKQMELGASGFEAAEDALHDTPTVDAVQVVRCKDCAHWKPCRVKGFEDNMYCEWAGWLVGGNAYCAYGEVNYMTDRAEIERLLNQTGRTLEGLPEEHTMAEKIDAAHRPGEWCEIVLHQSDVIELLVGALRDALDKPMQKPMTLEELKKAEVVWIEASEEDKPYPAFVDGISDKSVYFIAGKGIHLHAFLDQFGLMWRAWASSPTDEEWEAAAWEN